MGEGKAALEGAERGKGLKWKGERGKGELNAERKGEKVIRRGGKYHLNEEHFILMLCI